MHRFLSVVALLYLAAYTRGQGRPSESEISAIAKTATRDPTAQASATFSRGSGGGSGRTTGGQCGATCANGVGFGLSCPDYDGLHWCSGGNTVAVYAPTTAGACCCACSNTPGCYAWTYYPPWNVCFLWSCCAIQVYPGYSGATGGHKWCY